MERWIEGEERRGGREIWVGEVQLHRERAEMRRVKRGRETGGRKSVEQTECRVCVERINGGGEDEREVEREEEMEEGGCGVTVISIPALHSVSSQDK